MDRRELLRSAAALPLIASSMAAKNAVSGHMIKPKRLVTGDTVAIIAPASGATPEAFEKAASNLVSLGLKGKIGRSARGRLSHLSATDSERLADLHAAFSDPEVAAVWCIRGGGGAPRLLPLIDYSLIKKNPKIFIGFSDITALHIAISQNTGLVTFHGPVASSDLTEYSRKHLVNTVMQPSAPYKIDIPPVNAAKTSPFYRTETLVKGTCRGRLTGGNLSLLSALAGTPYALRDLKGKILFIEEIGEPPYRVDRMLTQLRQSCDLRSLAGIALGVFDDTSANAPTDATPLLDILRDRLGDLGIPLVYGLSFGHIKDNLTLPYGIEAELDATAATLKYLEPAVA